MQDTLYSVLEGNAARRPSQPALIAAGQTITHEEILARVDRLAAGLQALNLSVGDRVALLAYNRIESMVLFGACSRAGLVVFPLNWRLTEGEIDQQLQLAQAAAIVADGDNLQKVSAQTRAAIPVRIALDHPVEEDWLAFDELQGSVQPVYQAGSDDPFLLLATAAVSGESRAALLSHANLLTACDQVVRTLELGRSDRHLAALPLFHITGLELSLATLQAGGANVLMERFDPAEALGLIDRHGVTLLASFPPVLSMLLEAAQAGGVGWNTLRYVLGLDAPEVIQRLLGETNAAFWTGYGQSETTGVVTLIDVSQRPGSVGRPLAPVELQIFDEAGRPVGPGTVGEIVVRGPLVFLGYWRNEDATRYAGRHGWHHTGDLGRLDEQGYLYYSGRKPEKDLIKSGGENIYPAEIEQVISGLPHVLGVCVIGIEDDRWGEAVKAVIELEPGGDLSTAEVVEAVAQELASFKKPRNVEFVDRLPRDAAGLIDRAAVKAQFGE